MKNFLQEDQQSAQALDCVPVSHLINSATGAFLRIDSKDLFKQTREVEIIHNGRIYRLRLTQLNKLILTA